jgi:hypothetical protein
MNTLQTLSTTFKTGSLDHLIADAEIPVLTGSQAQGDVSWWPTRSGEVAGLIEVPAEGYPVVRGESGGNTHLLLADGPVFFAPATDLLRLGTLVVPEGSVAHMHHPEHGYNSIGAGTYIMKGQRTQMDKIRRVAD